MSAMMVTYATQCRCLGRPLRIEPGQCFTCGRSTGHPAARNHRDRQEMARPGLGALLEAVHRTRQKMRPKAPRHNHRRVVIERPPRLEGAKPDHVRNVEWLTRSF